MRLLICGARDWDDYRLVKSEIEDFIANIDQVECIVEGGAKGADYCAKLAAIELDIPYEEFPADWNRLGKRAGPIRNQQMVDEGKPDYLLAFHDKLVESRGTRSMLNAAKKAGIPCSEIKHDMTWAPRGVVHNVAPVAISMWGQPILNAN
jgi:hypothetical protein